MSAVTEKNQKIDPHSSKKVLKYNLNEDDFEILEHDVAKSVRTSRQEDRQEVLKFDSSSQGRFEKTDATIHKGENLDIPTFLRKNFTIRQVVE
jgi:mannose-6-phosphate isomerase class I